MDHDTGLYQVSQAPHPGVAPPISVNPNANSHAFTESSYGFFCAICGEREYADVHKPSKTVSLHESKPVAFSATFTLILRANTHDEAVSKVARILNERGLNVPEITVQPLFREIKGEK